MSQIDHTYDLLDKIDGYALWLRDDGRCAVTEISADGGQVFSCMPGDNPSDGGKWFARCTDTGIAYVSCAYSRSYARRKFRELTREASEAR